MERQKKEIFFFSSVEHSRDGEAKEGVFFVVGTLDNMGTKTNWPLFSRKRLCTRRGGLGV